MKETITEPFSQVSAEAGKGTEYHVSVQGNDDWEGSASAPFRTISAAASKAMPGDVITVHEGIYRERVNPPRGGESDAKRIVYQAAAGERVEIKGSEIIKIWEAASENIWRATLSNSFFGGFNPYDDLMKADWFYPLDRDHHTGAVYVNGDWLIEAASLEEVMKNTGNCWFAKVDDRNTTIWANFGGFNPNEERVEINARQTVFYPDQPGRNYITVRGFTMRHAATPWAPPTAEQIGLIGTHWSKGWIIEHNEISHSRCTGITLGKYGDEWDNFDPSADAYNKTIERALANGWARDNIGHHIVRNNTVSHCEMAGIAGSLGACFSVVTDNVVHDIHVQRIFSGAEQAGIKFHGAIDTLISNNRIYRSNRGIWLDWMTQGTRISRNLTYDIKEDDLFVEVSHGPFVADNNLFLSATADEVLRNMAQGGAYVHNLFIGTPGRLPQLDRSTPYHHEHSTRVAGIRNIEGGDDRFYNNIFIARQDRTGLSKYDTSVFPVHMDGNVFLNGALPSVHEEAPLQADGFDPGIELIKEDGAVYLQFAYDPAWQSQRRRKLVTSELLGRTQVSQLPYVSADDMPIRIDTDYWGQARDGSNPFPGPFEMSDDGKQRFKVWPNM